ncbi:MAG: hypothetical protein QME71_02200 [Dehalococcoidia bacterium]|nr:hypothetical protein [Dehalococcoidia bacterium]
MFMLASAVNRDNLSIRLPISPASALNDATTSYVYGLDLLFATDNNGASSYFLYDGLGSTTFLPAGRRG